MTRARRTAPTTPIRLGVSSCLLGQPVRYDGRHKRNALVAEKLGRHFEFVPLCPEVAIGMGVPRPPIRLVRIDGTIRARGIEIPTFDPSAQLARYAWQVAPQLTDVSGYVFKSNSPSCGVAGVKVFGTRGRPVTQGAGIFAGALRKISPALPVEEESGLADPVRRENFIERVLVFNRWQQLHPRSLTPAALAGFHARHRLIVLVHGGARAARELDRLASTSLRGSIAERGQRYMDALMHVLAKPATRAAHARVLRQLANGLREHLGTAELHRLASVIEAYRCGEISRGKVARHLVRHFRRLADSEVATDFYLNPHPAMDLCRGHTNPPVEERIRGEAE